METHGDTAHEDDEPFSLLLSNPMHAVFEGEGNVVLTSTGTILDNDDDLPVVSVDSGTVGVGEDVIFTVRISPEAGKTAFVYYRVDIRGPDMEHIGSGGQGTQNFIQGVTQNDLNPRSRKPQEVGEVYTLTVTGARDATVPEGTSGTIRVVGTADLPSVTIAADETSVTEGKRRGRAHADPHGAADRRADGDRGAAGEVLQRRAAGRDGDSAG